jgi:hypothetical protein
VAIPYFKDIYRDLVTQSDDKQKGINKITLLQVRVRRSLTHFIAYLKICFTARCKIYKDNGITRSFNFCSLFCNFCLTVPSPLCVVLVAAWNHR